MTKAKITPQDKRGVKLPVSSSRTKANARSNGLNEAQAPESGALSRGLAILDVLGTAERPLPLTEISTLTELTVSTVHRLLQTLARSNRVVRLHDGRFCLSPKALVPLNLHHPLHAMRRDSADVLATLQKNYGPTATIILFVGNQRFALEIKPGSDSFVGLLDIHLESFLHASSSGKLLLSVLHDDEIARELGHGPYPAFTKHTITSPDRFRTELKMVRSNGYSTNINEACEGLSAVSAPIIIPGLKKAFLGSITLTGSSKFFTPQSIERIATDLKLAAHLFSVASPATRNVARFIGIS